MLHVKDVYQRLGKEELKVYPELNDLPNVTILLVPNEYTILHNNGK